MAVIKVIELLAESAESWEDATNNAFIEAQKTVRNIKSIYIENFQAIVEGDHIANYRVNAKISFAVEH